MIILNIGHYYDNKVDIRLTFTRVINTNTNT